ncbi:MAG: GNAT family N-acetyltransferase [Methanobacterium sp.]
MIIECDNCILRSWKPSDIENLVKNANNLKIASNMRDGFPFPYTLAHGRHWISVAMNNSNFFAITVDDEAIGGIGIAIGEDIERISAEVGYWLGEEYWGKGIVSSALKGMVNYCFQELDLQRIFAVPLEHNHTSRRVLEKSGFELEGILRKSVIKFGEIHNQALYAVIKE